MIGKLILKLLYKHKALKIEVYKEPSTLSVITTVKFLNKEIYKIKSPEFEQINCRHPYNLIK